MATFNYSSKSSIKDNLTEILVGAGLIIVPVVYPFGIKVGTLRILGPLPTATVSYTHLDVYKRQPQVGLNLSLHDPRNYNLKKHMVRLAIYELTKLIAPNNVSVVRMRDYEDSMKWLNDAAKLRLNPQIPRKVDDTKKPVTDWQLATFQTDYDPYRNPWLT